MYILIYVFVTSSRIFGPFRVHECFQLNNLSLFNYTTHGLVSLNSLMALRVVLTT